MAETITHINYETGEKFEVPVKESNVTDTEVYLTDDYFNGFKTRGHKGDTFSSNYKDFGKKVFYKDSTGKKVEIMSLNGTHVGTRYDFVMETKDGKKITKSVPVEK